MEEGPEIVANLLSKTEGMQNSFEDGYGIDDATACEPRVFMNVVLVAAHTRALLELCPRKAIVDDWSRQQIRYFRKWFWDNREPLSLMPETQSL